MKCKFCRYVFLSRGKEKLQVHIIHCKDNPKRIPYTCKECNKDFDTKYSYIGHKSNCGKQRPKTRPLYKTKGHKPKTKEKITKCHFCKYQNDNYLKLAGHISSCKFNPNYFNRIEKLRESGIGRNPTKETRNKLSKNKTDYLIKNPDKVPYLLNHSSKESYPEKLFRECLIKENIVGWEQEYRIHLYSYDFAFPKLKIDVEIDGSTHTSEKVKVIDNRRDKWSEENGWKVIRFTAKEIKENMTLCIDKLKTSISGL